MIGQPLYYVYWNINDNEDVICVMDYDLMRENMYDFCEELVKKVFEPKRIQKICDIYELDMVDYLELL